MSISRKTGGIVSKTQPIFDPGTRYRIELRGRVDVEWLQGFDILAEITVEEDGHRETITVLNVITDQAGIVGLVRKLHGLGITILQLQIIPVEGKSTKVEGQN